MRYSVQRDIILKIVLESSDHPDAKTIYERVKIKIPNISLGTVYRNLNNLVLNNQIKKVEVLNDSDRYDKTLYNHNHIYCIKCHKVFDISIIHINDINKIIEDDTHFIITDLKVLVEGICHNCR